MPTIGFGDLARTQPLSRQGAQARADMARLSQELTTGRHGDLARTAEGDLGAVAGIERALSLLGRSQAAATAVQGRMDAMQAALDGMRKASQTAASDLMIAGTPGAAVGIGQAEAISRAALGTVVSALSTRIGGVHLFSGAASDGAPLPAAEAMIDALRADVGPISDAPALRAAVRDWFAPGGGLDARWPRPGGDEAMVVPVAPGETLRVEATAADPEIRRVMADLAVGVLAGEGGGLDAGARRAALRAAGVALTTDEAGFTGLRGRLGVAEGQSERALARTRAEISALEIARGEALEVDRYEVATRFQAAQAAVETLYLVTARLSGLSLANYLR